MTEIERKKGDVITIGDDITIRVVGMWSGGVRLAIKAPRSIRIVRAELLERTEEKQGGDQ